MRSGVSTSLMNPRVRPIRGCIQRALTTPDTTRAMTKLADLGAHTKGGDPAELARKRAVIEAALQRAKARRA